MDTMLAEGADVPVPPVTVICAHEMYSWAPPTEPALCRAMCSMRSR